MRWTLAHSINHLHHWTLEYDQSTAELKYNKQARSFRLTASDKRLFFIEKTGFLQNKFLLRTEYSVITGEILPVRNGHSGIAVFENKKYHYLLKDQLLFLSLKKEGFSLAIGIDNVEQIDQAELCTLIFGTLRIAAKSYAVKREAVLA